VTIRAGWTSVELSELIAEGPSNGFSPPSDHGAPGTLTLKLSATTSGRFVLNDATTKRIHETIPPQSKYWLRTGDIVIQRANSLEYVGTTALFLGPDQTYIYPDLMMRIRPNAAADPSYLCSFLNAPQTRASLRSRATGTAGNMPKINGETVRSTLVNLPPLNEQRRIVAKLESLQARSRRAREALDAVPPLLEKLRQSILAAAFRGDLTKDWRAKNKDVEPASELLKRIRVERRKKWEEGELAKMRAKGKAPGDGRWKEKYREPEPGDADGLPELPDSWCWTSLDELLLRIDAGRSPKAHGRPATSTEQGVLKVSAVSWEEFDPSENKALLDGEQIGDTPTVRSGDLLISRANTVQLVGAVVLVEQDHTNLMLSDKTLRLVPASSEFPPELLLHALRTHEVRAEFEDDATGTSDSMRNLTQDKIRAALIPLPPAAEAAVLVRILSAATRTRRSIDRQRFDLVASMSRLERATLAKAFSGELVKQDADDEPAEAMLARLGSENDGAARSGTDGPRPRKWKVG
jgi:type I restriction enzyme S subunit